MWYFVSEVILNSEILIFCLWSDGGGDEVELNFFDDLGVWYDVELKFFFNNVLVDIVGKSIIIGY